MRKQAIAMGMTPNILYVAVDKGEGSIHYGNIWHGSGPNLGNAPRRSLVIYAMPAEVRYRRDRFLQGPGQSIYAMPVYLRYAHLDSGQMDENYFSIVWHNKGYQTPGLDQYIGMTK